jgi:hypothetical protein
MKDTPVLKLFAWLSGASTGYSMGTIAVIAATVEEAREKIAADVDRWMKFGEDEGSPCWFNYDQTTGKLWDEEWDDHDRAAFEEAKQQVLDDIARDPIKLPESGILWRAGGG